METLPKDFFLREHNREVYVNEKIHKKLHFINNLPFQHNEYGEFTQYITDANADIETASPESIGEGVDFFEIAFGKPSEKRGSLAGKGFKFGWTNKITRQGRLNATFQIFLSKAVSRLVNFYDDIYANDFIAGAGASAPKKADMSNWNDDSSIDPVTDELTILQAFDNDNFGYVANTIYLNRADYYAKTAYDKAMKLAGKSPQYECQYVNIGGAIPAGKYIAVDHSIPVGDVEKYTDPEFSTIRQAEITAEKQGKELTGVPDSLINVWYPPKSKPTVNECYLWVESKVNILEPMAVMAGELY